MHTKPTACVRTQHCSVQTQHHSAQQDSPFPGGGKKKNLAKLVNVLCLHRSLAGWNVKYSDCSDVLQVLLNSMLQEHITNEKQLP